MKTIIKYCRLVCMLGCTCISDQLFAQNAMYIKPGTQVFITAGTNMSIDSLVLIPSADLVINGENAFEKTTSILHPSANKYVKRVYQAMHTLPAFSGSIAVYYKDEELDGLNENDLTLNIHDGSRWNAFPVTVTRNVASNVVTTSGLTGAVINELALTSFATPLPLHWLQVEAHLSGENAVIHWQTAEELNVDHYQVYKSSDAIAWQKVGLPIPAKNVAGPNFYSMSDSNVKDGITYYRVSETERDGRHAYSKIVSVTRNTQDAFFSLAPNPANTETILIVNAPTACNASLMVLNLQGQVLFTSKVMLQKGKNHVPVHIATLPAGIYSLKLFTATKIFEVKMAKQ